MAPRFKRDKHGIPDPLHFQLPHTHVKLLELLYVIAIVGAMVCILLYGTMLGWPRDVLNTSITMMMVLGVLLAIMVIEKSMVGGMAKKAESHGKR